MIQWAIRSAVALCLVAPCLVMTSLADDEKTGSDVDVSADVVAPDSPESLDGDGDEKDAEKDPQTAAESHAKGHEDDKEGEGEGHDGHKVGGAGAAHDEDGHGAESHGGENPHDLSHSNALPTQEAAEEWKFDLAIYSFVVFLLLLGILLKFAWGPIMEALHSREQGIAAMIDEAKQSAADAQKNLAAYEAKLAKAHTEADEIVSRAKDSAQQQADSILADAKAASQRERDRAVADIELAKNEALGEITQRSVDIALGLAKSVVGREIKADDHDSLIKEALAKFPS